jgi:hypothetical protein
MQDLFEVGPPLPPSNLNAQGMLETLDERFQVFDFQAYHHAFCHFLNLHIDQYSSIEEFNKEFAAVLEDLLDYGHPLSNTQACSAYFSKLRCTQNPWVAKRLEEWNAQSSEPEIHDLMQESPPWSCIRPLATKPSQTFQAGTTPEEHLEDSSGQSDSDAAPELSDTSTESSQFSHSRQISSSTIHSQEITVHASTEDLAAPNPHALREALEKLPEKPSPERLSSKAFTPAMTESTTPAWLNVAPTSFLDRPLPPLPNQKPETESRARSASPRLPITTFRNISQTSLTVPTMSVIVRPRTADATSIPATLSSQLQLETVHPLLRPRSQTLAPTPPPLSDHPAFRNASPSSEYSSTASLFPATAPIKSSIAPYRTVFPALDSPVFPANLAVPSSTPERKSRWSDSSRTTLLFSEPHPHSAPLLQHAFAPSRRSSNSSSVISLPLQGTRDSAWNYMDLHHQTLDSTRNHSVQSRSFHVNDEGITALPSFEFETKGNMSRAPTFDDFVMSTHAHAQSAQPPAIPSLISRIVAHKKSSSLDFVSRLSGESLLESSSEVREREVAEKRKRERKGKGWSIGVNIARFTHSKGVKEII